MNKANYRTLKVLFHVFFMVYLSLYLSSCAPGTSRNVLLYNDVLDDSITVTLSSDISSNVSSSNTMFSGHELLQGFMLMDTLEKEMIKRKFIINSPQHNARYHISIQDISYTETPETDTYEEDGVTKTMQTKKYHFELKGKVQDLKDGSFKSIYSTIRSNSYAGKNLLGEYVEKNDHNPQSICEQGINRFAGKVTKHLNKINE